MFDLTRNISEIEARAKSHGVPIKRICQLAGVAPSNWNRWKTGANSPTFQTWAKIERAASTLAPIDPSSLTANERAVA